MSAIALHILELVRSLPSEEQQIISHALNRQLADSGRMERRRLVKTPDGRYFNPDGLPDDHPFFKIMEQIEEERHRTPARALPEFD